MKRNCEICGSRENKLIFKQKFVLPTKNYFHAGYNVVICKDCGFVFSDNIPDQSFFNAYYKNMAKKSFYIKNKLKKKTQNSFVKDKAMQAFNKRFDFSIRNIKKYLCKEAKILDVGCYTGELLAILKKQGYQNVTGLDPSSVASKIAKERHGIRVITGEPGDGLDIGKYDFIILTQVLEHIKDLKKFIFGLSSYLKDDGLIYIETPDANNFFISQSDEYLPEHQEPFQQFSVEHINFFSKISLFNLMMQNGFDKVFLESQVSLIAIIASIWKKKNLLRDDWIGKDLSKYIEESASLQKIITSIIDMLNQKKIEIFVWGAGLHTQKLLASSNLIKTKIRAFIDSNKSYHKGTLIGRPIIDPSKLKALPSLPILISSRGYQEEIGKQIKEMCLKSDVLFLYKNNH